VCHTGSVGPTRGGPFLRRARTWAGSGRWRATFSAPSSRVCD
jgi:hypothetical protein